MAASFKQFGLRAMSGEDKSALAAVAQAATAIVEPFYSGAMLARNRCYDLGLFHTHDLGRPAISVGNITTGGTGKTPVVQWLCKQLQQRGRHPAILLRGYGAGAFSDEAQLLFDALKNVPVQANPSRIAGAAQVLKAHPEVDVFVLDDAFQHRKVRRNFNLVLISATQPFGFGHVLPRGLLREPLRGLKRADAFLITRCSLVPPEKLAEIELFLTENHPTIPIFRADHQLTGLWLPETDERSSLEVYAGERVFLAAGIGDPSAFAQQIASYGCHIAGTQWFSDHHAFTTSDIISINHSARMVNADIVLTTGKDWVKMKSQMPQASELPIGMVQLEVCFANGGGNKLMMQMLISVDSKNR